MGFAMRRDYSDYFYAKKIREIQYLTVVSLEFLSISLPLQRSPAAPPKGSRFNVLYFSM